MSKLTQSIKSYKLIYPQIYSYILPELKANKGSQKIGYSSRENVDERILEQVRTAAINLEYKKLWSAPAFYQGNRKAFSDADFHLFLEKKGIERRYDLGKEWFYFNDKQYKSKELFDLFRKEGFNALQRNRDKTPYTLREEQEEAVTKTLKYFKENEKGEFLWNAKPRFGKTLASYDLAKRLNAKKVLIVTNRPAIANSWFDDFEKFIDGYAFISETSSLRNRETITREQYKLMRPMLPQFTFLSLQDLKGSKYFGGDYDKLAWVAELEWDLLIIDEAHEGIDTTRTDAAFDVIKRKYTLHLSGTPFKALANEKFPNEAIYNWTYLDEQKMKQIELEEGEAGPHTDLPDLRLFTYRISQMITDQVNKGIEIEDETHDYAFDLNEFFSTSNRKFVRENEVKAFLRNLTTNKKYPFSTPELREELKHTFWYVGNRVESVKALEKLLKEDPVFKDYKVVVAAGDGRTFEEEEYDFRNNEKSFERVKKAIAENDKTITLSCGQLTTGVTVKEWTAVLMLTDIKSPALYMQAAFRAQNPYKEMRDGNLYVKKSSYLFDFAPSRVLEIYDDFANGLNPKAVQGEITQKEREENIKELLNFFPVISEDVNGEMVELNAQQVLTFPNALAASEIVNARFMTNLLFNDSVKGVFNFPKQVEEILNKLPEEKNKRIRKPKSNLDLEEAKEINRNKEIKINDNTGIILGEKIYRTNTERIIGDLLNQNQKEINPKELVDKITEVAEPLIAKYKEVYKATQAETKQVTTQLQEKIKEIAEEYNSAEIKDAENLKQQLNEAIEKDFVQNKVEEKEEQVVEKVQKTKEEEIRDRLRSFTRTIPMFIMANDDKTEITIDNFDLEIDDEDFEEITSITKEEFHTLRDGFEYEENGQRKRFEGVFNKYRFNAAIAEFRQKKEELSDYFTVKDDIFELIPNQKTNQIFTPRNVVKMMIDQLEEHDPTLFTRADSTFIDLYMKSGMYITEIVKKLFKNTRKQYKSDDECLKHILENQVYGLAPTPILQGITQSYIFGFDRDTKIDRKNFVQYDLTPDAQEGKAKEKLYELYKLKEDMKFDAVVGNPPYQENIKNRGEQPSIYHYFIDISQSISDLVCLITPARFLSNVGSTPKKFNLRMLQNKHFKILDFFQKSSLVFPNTDIKGGVVISLYNKSMNFGAIGVFTTFPQLNNILKKVMKNNPSSISDILISNTSYRYSTKLFEDYPMFSDRLSGGSRRYAASSAFNVLSEIFFDKKPDDNDEYIQLLGRQNNERVYKFVARKYFLPPHNLDKYKVLVPSSNGSGAIGEVLSTPLIGHPLIGHTETFISFGAFDKKEEAENLLKYIKSKFSRTMLGILKVTQGNKTKHVWSKVPLQDFTENSDIDWSKSIPEIDQQLYKKYNLSEEEIAFIEEKVQAMD